MKKFFFAVLCALGLATTAVAQETFRKDDSVLNLGIGVSNYGGVSLPPLSATYERSVADGIIDKGSIGLGVSAELTAFKVGGLSMFVGPRAAFHYEFVDNLDTYIGVEAGLGLASSQVSFDWSGIVGARYYFGQKFGVFGEFGTGLSVFKLGATFRF